MTNFKIRILQELPSVFEPGALYITKSNSAGFLDIQQATSDGSVVHKNIPLSVIQSMIEDGASGKEDTLHYHLLSEVTDLVTILDSKQAVGDYATNTQLDTKQDQLVSGVNISTLNTETLLGSGNLVIEASNSHSDLTGLLDDDHLQYFTEQRGDSRYSKVSHLHNVNELSSIGLVENTVGDNRYKSKTTSTPEIHALVESFIVAGTNVTIDSQNGILTINMDDAGFMAQAENLLVKRIDFDGHGHTIDQVLGLQTELDSKQDIGDFVETIIYDGLMDAKQNKLYSGVNIVRLGGAHLIGTGDLALKKINTESVLGTGNLLLDLMYFTVTKVNGREGDVILDKSDVDLDQVDNTKDSNKLISTSFQTDLNKKLNVDAGTLTGPLVLFHDAVGSKEAISYSQLTLDFGAITDMVANGTYILRKNGDNMLGPLKLVSNSSLPLHSITLQDLLTKSTEVRDRVNHTGLQSIASIEDLQNTLSSKQNALTNGSTIKTILTKSVLGVGDITFNHSDLGDIDQDTHLNYFNQLRADNRYLQITDLKNRLFSVLSEGTNVTITDTGTQIEISSLPLIAQTNSVHGNVGTVILTAVDVGSESVGTVNLDIVTHEAEADPHPQYLSSADVANGTDVTTYYDAGTGKLTVDAVAHATVDSLNGLKGKVVLTAPLVYSAALDEASDLFTSHSTDVDPHAQYFNQVRGDETLSEKIHTHSPDQVKDIDENIRTYISNTLKTDGTMGITYPPSGEVVLGAPNYLVTDIDNSYKVISQNNMLNDQHVSVKFPVPQSDYKYNAFALKELIGLENQPFNVESFTFESSLNYNYSPDLLWGGALKINKGGQVNLDVNGGYFTKTINTLVNKMEVESSNLTKVLIPYLDSTSSQLGYNVTASSVTTDPLLAFDSSTTSVWRAPSPNVNGPQWVQIEQPSGTIVRQYTLNYHYSLGYSFKTYTPEDWMFQGSNDGVTWTTLDTVTGSNILLSSVNNVSIVRSIPDNQLAFKFYRLYITKSHNDISVIVAQLKVTGLFPLNFRDENGTFYNYADGSFVPLAQAFDSYFIDTPAIPDTQLTSFSSLELVSQYSTVLNIWYYPYPQVALSTKKFDIQSWKDIYDFSVTLTKTGYADFRLLVLDQNGIFWTSYKTGQWESVEGITGVNTTTAQAVISKGMSSDTLEAMTKEDWKRLAELTASKSFSKLSIILAVSITNPKTDDIQVQSIDLKYDIKSIWKRATLSDVEIRWSENSIDFTAVTAGNYKFIYQEPKADIDFNTDVGTSQDPTIELQNGFYTTFTS